MSAIAGLRGTGDWGTDERPKNFREGILRFNSAGTAPIFALSSKAGKRTTDDPEFSWWAEGNPVIRLRSTASHSATETVIAVGGVDPTSTTLGANLGAATHLKEGDLLLVEPLTEPTGTTAVNTDEILRVTNVVSDTQFTVSRGAAGTTAATIANLQYMLVIGSAYAEGTGVPRATTRNPIKYNNLIQIFKDTYELTGTADVTKTRTNNNYSEDKKRKSFKHSADIEMALMFGKKNETTGENGKPLRYMGGLKEMIPAANTWIFASGACTPNALMDKIGPVFDFDTGAGDTRMGFAGNSALIALSKVFANEFTYNTNETVKVYGMNFVEFIMPMGRLLIKSHPLLSRNTLYANSMFIVDFDAFKYVTQKGRPDGKAHDDVQAKDEDVRRGYFQTDCSLEVGYGGLTMAYLGNINSGSL